MDRAGLGFGRDHDGRLGGGNIVRIYRRDPLGEIPVDLLQAHHTLHRAGRAVGSRVAVCGDIQRNQCMAVILFGRGGAVDKHFIKHHGPSWISGR